MAKQAKSTVFEDNDRVRVTEWRFAPGTETGQHLHRLDYTVVPLSTGTLIIVAADGESENNIVHGRPYFRRSGAEHNVVNRSDREIAFMEIEVK